jgi:hypothetical protein
MLLRFQKAAARGNFETGNQAFSMRLRFLTTGGICGAVTRVGRPAVGQTIILHASTGHEFCKQSQERSVVGDTLHDLRCTIALQCAGVADI